MIPQEGSPPRVRGKGPCRPSGGHLARITPACAGKSSTPPVYHKPRGDHPRVCGEKSYTVAFVILYAGSPPRVRGKVMAFSSSDSAFRITPACAGKRIQNEAEPRKWTDHPRVCGEKMFSISGDVKYPGSPPRVRGKVGFIVLVQTAIGITPACAGKRLKRSHSIGHFSYILCLFHSVLHRASASGGSRAGPCAPPCLPAQNAVPV